MKTTEWRLDMKLRDPRMLRQYMEYKGMTIRQVAKAAGVSPSLVGHLLTGERTGSRPENARKIEEALACPPGLLFDARASNVQREVAA